MGEAHQRIQPECAGAALDRMHRAKHGIDRLPVAIAALDREQPAFQFGELLLALLEEGLLDGLHRIHRFAAGHVRQPPGGSRPPASPG